MSSTQISALNVLFNRVREWLERQEEAKALALHVFDTPGYAAVY